MVKVIVKHLSADSKIDFCFQKESFAEKYMEQ